MAIFANVAPDAHQATYSTFGTRCRSSKMPRLFVALCASLRQHCIHNLTQIARRPSWIGRKRKRRDDGDAVGPRADHRPRIAHIDAGDAADRQFLPLILRPAPQHPDDARQPFGADRRILLLLRQRCIDAARADVIDQRNRRHLRLTYVLDRKSDDGVHAQEAPRVLDLHVVLAKVHAVGARGECDVHAVIDHKRHGERRQRFPDRARFIDHGARVAHLVAQLHERGPALGAKPRKLGQIMAAGTLGVHDGIEAEVDLHHDTFARARNVARSRLCRASRIQLENRPGPRADCAATSPATPSAISAALVASHASVSTASAAQTSAEPAQPIPVTRLINGSPLAMVTRRAPSVTISAPPVSATTVVQACATREAASSAGSPPNNGANSAALSRTTLGSCANRSRAYCARPGDRSMKTGSSTHGMRALCTALSATSTARRRSSSKVPRLTRSASALATKLTISSGAIVIEGTAPAASSILAV